MIDVTCAIIHRNGKILVTQRSEKMNQPLLWEFPGGKVENNETPEECLVREIKEELNIKIELKERMEGNKHDYSSFSIHLIPFTAEYLNGEISLLEHKAYQWLDKKELLSLEWAPADIPILQKFLDNHF